MVFALFHVEDFVSTFREVALTLGVGQHFHTLAYISFHENIFHERWLKVRFTKYCPLKCNGKTVLANIFVALVSVHCKEGRWFEPRLELFLAAHLVVTGSVDRTVT